MKPASIITILQQIAKEAAGGSWSAESSSAKNYVSSSVSKTAIPKSASTGQFSAQGSSSNGKASGVSTTNTEWDDSNWSSYQSGGGYQSGNSSVPQVHSKQKEEFFARKQTENASRRDDLPPSQGGKYAGFGNTVQPPPRSQSDFDLSGQWQLSGWSSAFGTIASKASENVSYF